MTHIYTKGQILKVMRDIDINETLESISEGFVAYSKGRVVVPPVGEMLFENPPGETHIKYGYIVGDDYYVIKIASGFYPDGEQVTAHGSGLMMLFSQKNGEPVGIFLDGGYLTNVRTAAAGAVVARFMAPRHVDRIGIMGAGIQGRLQLEYLMPVISCRDVVVWGVNQDELVSYKNEMEKYGFAITTTTDVGEVAANCKLIVTATPSTRPLFTAEQIRKGTHITAMGSDTPQKIELAPDILAAADIVVSDSIEQSRFRGEIFHARKSGLLDDNKPVELGNVITNASLKRSAEGQTTVADLTGVAVQDIQICKTVYQALND